MSTYRKEWNCCGSVTETEAWEPDTCPFCSDSQTIRQQQAEIERLKSQRDRLVNALDDASQAVWGYSDYRHDMGHIDIADKFNLMYGEHRALIAEIEAEK